MDYIFKYKNNDIILNIENNKITNLWDLTKLYGLGILGIIINDNNIPFSSEDLRKCLSIVINLITTQQDVLNNKIKDFNNYESESDKNVKIMRENLKESLEKAISIQNEFKKINESI